MRSISPKCQYRPISSTLWRLKFFLTSKEIKAIITIPPKTRRALATTLRETDKAIKITKNSDMRKSLRTSRVLVSDLLQMPTENVDAAGQPQ